MAHPIFTNHPAFVSAFSKQLFLLDTEPLIGSKSHPSFPHVVSRILILIWKESGKGTGWVWANFEGSFSIVPSQRWTCLYFPFMPALETFIDTRPAQISPQNCTAASSFLLLAQQPLLSLLSPPVTNVSSQCWFKNTSLTGWKLTSVTKF